ncbi:MAG: hypothetical protein ABI761_13225 [Saprospiraceae bacterium]
MRLITFFLLLSLILSCSSAKNTTVATNKLNGTWTPLRQEMAGVTIPQIAFAYQKLTILDTTYSFIAESVDKGIIKYTSDKMDIYGKEGVNAGKHITAIYKFAPNAVDTKEEQLTICYDLSGKTYPESYDTKGKTLHFLSVFTKN